MTRSVSSQDRSETFQRLTLAAALAIGLLLRLWFIAHAARIAGDTLVYGDIAKNWLDHGVYGFTQTTPANPYTAPLPTLIRLPGYPAFLALCFSLFGREHYTAVMVVQAVLDLVTCWVLATLAGRLFGPRAFRAALWLGVLCPFTASYVAAPLAETLTLLCIAIAYYALQRWRETQDLDDSGREATLVPPINRWLFLVAAALSYAILLRPEQGLLAAAVVPAIAWTSLCSILSSKPHSKGTIRTSLLRKSWPTVLTACLVALPLAPWAVRNWRTFHVIQPLAPRYATDPGESVPLGFQRWYRTWAIEFTSTEDVYWNYEGDRIDVADIPTRAFDNETEYAATDALLAEYNETYTPTPGLDACFNALAEQRIEANPIRFYVALPVARLLNMALRPRTEMLPIALEWWKFKDHPGQTVFATTFAALNLAYFVLAGLGLRRWYRANRNGEFWNAQAPLAWAMIASIALRAALLLTLDNSEPRYTLEFFPILIVAAAALFGSSYQTTESGPIRSAKA
ncbi:MAG: hypothetical protein JWM43_2430 [Acidobacteriaceae bacterium]|nr:hypothetical protein [Acidobacteriaceae bacterium]